MDILQYLIQGIDFLQYIFYLHKTMQGSKKTWIPACPLGKQLSHLLVCGHFLLLLVNDFVRGWLAWTRLQLLKPLPKYECYLKSDELSFAKNFIHISSQNVEHFDVPSTIYNLEQKRCRWIFDQSLTGPSEAILAWCGASLVPRHFRIFAKTNPPFPTVRVDNRDQFFKGG